MGVPADSADDLVSLDCYEPPGQSPVCTWCRHLRRGRACAAFPERDSIPMPIWLGEHDHRTPYPGDHGIHFEPVQVGPKVAPTR